MLSGIQETRNNHTNHFHNDMNIKSFSNYVEEEKDQKGKWSELWLTMQITSDNPTNKDNIYIY